MYLGILTFGRNIGQLFADWFSMFWHQNKKGLFELGLPILMFGVLWLFITNDF